MRRLISFIIVLALSAGIAMAALPTSQQVTDLLHKNFAGIRDYRADAFLTVKSTNINVTGMSMTIFYKQPGKVHIEAKEGLAILPRDLRLGDPSREMLKNATVRVLRMGTMSGRKAIVVKFIPNDRTEESKDLTTAWIDAERGLVLATAGGGDKMPGVKTYTSYVQVDGGYWLPSEIRADIKMPASPDTDRPRREPHRPGVMDGTAVIKFSNYKVNTGLPDSLFKQPEKPGQ